MPKSKNPRNDGDADKIKFIRKQIKDLQLRALEINHMQICSKEWKLAEEQFWQNVEQLSDNAVGLVGKHIRFSVADGYADYLISGADKKIVQVAHLDIGDGYHSEAESSGVMLRATAEKSVKWLDGITKIFGKK
jgi:hypothetical protein